MRANLPVRADRIAEDIDGLAALTDPERPWTRRAFTPRFLDGREFVERRMRAAGLETRIDAAGNLIGRRPGRVPGLGTIAVGSHSDTVPDGGRFDGIAGVAAGLEVARALADAGIVLDHDLEVIDCLAEEVSLFGVSCVGSRAIAGVMPPEWIVRQDAGGRTLGEAMREVGGEPERLAEARRSDIRAFLELHIEQGPVLEAEGLDVGLVTAIAGITRLEVVVDGRADHAGTTPMDRRADALVAAAALVTAINGAARRRAAGGQAHFAATVGEFRIEPGAANVVPSKAVMLVDARAEVRADMEAFRAELDGLVAAIAAEHGVAIAPPRLVSDNPPTPADARLLDHLAAASDGLGAGSRRMASGAGHDTAWFARVAPAAMIFVPCRDGRSHTPEEWAETDAIALGAAVIFEAVRRIDADGALRATDAADTAADTEKR
jgi:N-carbamoyl-L-amino-acid hydrolase